MINIVATGNLSKDCETKYLQNGTCILEGSIAVNQGKDKQALFIDFKIFGKYAEVMSPYLNKGTKLLLNGELERQFYVGKDGTNKHKDSIIVSKLELIGGKKEDLNNGSYEKDEYKDFP